MTVQTIANRPLIRRQGIIGRIGIALGFVGLIIGVTILMQMPSTPAQPEDTAIPSLGVLAAVVIGMVAFSIGMLRYQLYVKKPTPLQSITEALKTGNNKKCALLSYLPHLLPAQHVFVSQAGVTVLLTKHVEGKVTGSEDRWKHTPLHRLASAMSPWTQIRLGNPVKEALAAEDNIKVKVAEALGETVGTTTVPVQSIVVFTHPTVTVSLDNPTIPGVLPNELRGCVARMGQAKLTPVQIDKIVTALKGDFEIETETKRRAPKKAASKR